jgi:hypothetical protein
LQNQVICGVWIISLTYFISDGIQTAIIEADAVTKIIDWFCNSSGVCVEVALGSLMTELVQFGNFLVSQKASSYEFIILF